MTAQVIALPTAADLRSRLACTEEWADDLYEGRRLAGEWNPELQNVYGGQDIAVGQADAAAADLRKELEALEKQAQANGTAATVRH